MEKFYNIPDTYINKLARLKKVKHRSLSTQEVIAGLAEKGHIAELKYLNKQFRFAEKASGLTICKPHDQFPTKSSTASKFIETLIKEKQVLPNQIDNEWRPDLKDELQLCSVIQDGDDVFLKMVKAKEQMRRVDYDSVPQRYAEYSSAVIHFSDEVIEIRAALTKRNEYIDFVLKLLGYPEKMRHKWFPLTEVSKQEAKAISSLLTAGLASEQIALPTDVGSIRLNGRRNVDMRNNPWYQAIKKAIETLGISTDDTMDEHCQFDFVDPLTGVIIPVHFVINLKNGGLSFRTRMTQAAIEHVLDAFIHVLYANRGVNFLSEIAASFDADDHNDIEVDEEE